MHDTENYANLQRCVRWAHSGRLQPNACPPRFYIIYQSGDIVVDIVIFFSLHLSQHREVSEMRSAHRATCIECKTKILSIIHSYEYYMQCICWVTENMYYISGFARFHNFMSLFVNVIDSVISRYISIFVRSILVICSNANQNQWI